MKSGQGNSQIAKIEGLGARIGKTAELIGTRKAASDVSGVSNDMLYRYIRESSAPSFAAVARLCRRAGVSLEWMATGEGPMRLDARQEGAVQHQAAGPRTSSGRRTLPGPDQGEAGGCWLHAVREPAADFRTSGKEEARQLDPDIPAFVQVWGDSMEPTIRSGSLVALDASRQELVDDGICLLRIAGQLTVRRLRSQNGSWKAVGDNPTCPPRALGDDDEVLGAVAGIFPPLVTEGEGEGEG